MIGDMIAIIRKEKGMTKTELAEMTGINIGHLTHIEKGERNPSHKALRNICKALDVPYQQLMYTYDKELNEDQTKYGLAEHIAYNKVLAVDNLNAFVDCPSSAPSASLAIKVPDDAMEGVCKKGDYIFVEFNSPLVNKDIGLFSVNGQIVIRRFFLKKGKYTLKADNKSFRDIAIADTDSFYIIGKVL